MLTIGDRLETIFKMSSSLATRMSALEIKIGIVTMREKQGDKMTPTEMSLEHRKTFDVSQLYSASNEKNIDCDYNNDLGRPRQFTRRLTLIQTDIERLKSILPNNEIRNTIIDLQKQIADLGKESPNSETNFDNYADTADNVEEPFLQSRNRAATMASSVARVFPRIVVRGTKSVDIQEDHDVIPLAPRQMRGIRRQSTSESSTSDDDYNSLA